MQYLFLYERKQRKTAKIVLLNMSVLLAMFIAAHHFVEKSQAGMELLYWVNIAFPIVEAILLLFALYLWTKNGAFHLSLTTATLKMHDPMFKEYSWEVKISDILEIKHRHQKQGGHTTIKICLKNEEARYLTTNYNYDRKKLYEAIAQCNPNVIMPESAYRFKQV